MRISTIFLCLKVSRSTLPEQGSGERIVVMDEFDGSLLCESGEGTREVACLGFGRPWY